MTGGILPFDGHASHRSQFAPVIFILNHLSVCRRVLFQMNFPRRSRKENSFENYWKRGWQTKGDFSLMEGESFIIIYYIRSI